MTKAALSTMAHVKEASDKSTLIVASSFVVNVLKLLHKDIYTTALIYLQLQT